MSEVDLPQRLKKYDADDSFELRRIALVNADCAAHPRPVEPIQECPAH